MKKINDTSIMSKVLKRRRNIKKRRKKILKRKEKQRLNSIYLPYLQIFYKRIALIYIFFILST
jgi:hypothetical protein